MIDDQEDDDESCMFFPYLDIDPAVSGMPLPKNPKFTYRMINMATDDFSK